MSTGQNSNSISNNKKNRITTSKDTFTAANFMIDRQYSLMNNLDEIFIWNLKAITARTHVILRQQIKYWEEKWEIENQQ